MKKLITILVMLQMQNASAQINNNSFEQWDTTYVNAYSAELSNVFGVANPLGGTINKWVTSSGYGLSRTTDSYSGNFAAIVHNWYNYAYEWLNYDDTLTSRPQFLQGYFKYITGGANGISHGLITVALTRTNGSVIDVGHERLEHRVGEGVVQDHGATREREYHQRQREAAGGGEEGQREAEARAPQDERSALRDAPAQDRDA